MKLHRLESLLSFPGKIYDGQTLSHDGFVYIVPVKLSPVKQKPTECIPQIYYIFIKNYRPLTPHPTAKMGILTVSMSILTVAMSISAVSMIILTVS